MNQNWAVVLIIGIVLVSACIGGWILFISDSEYKYWHFCLFAGLSLIAIKCLPIKKHTKS